MMWYQSGLGHRKGACESCRNSAEFQEVNHILGSDREYPVILETNVSATLGFSAIYIMRLFREGEPAGG